MEQPMSHPTDSSIKQFGNNTITTTLQPIIIDSNAELQAKENLLDTIAELKEILHDSIKALSPQVNQ